MVPGYYFAAHFPMAQIQSVRCPVAEFPSSDLQSRQATQEPPNKIQRTDSVVSTSPIQSLPDVDTGIDEQRTSPFFRLPAELRNQIYNELLCSGTCNLKELAAHPQQPTTPPPVYPAILSTCRRIYDEAADMLYTTHVFHAHHSLLTALPHLTPDGRPVLYPTVLSKIRRWHLTMRLDIDPRFTAAQAARAFSGAEYLDIKVWQSMFDGCNAAVLKLFLGIRGVKVVRVSGSVNDELARWLEMRMMMPDEERDMCECEERRELMCGRCCKRVENTDWFEERDAWRFGNR
jgi:hypothetical protein